MNKAISKIRIFGIITLFLFPLELSAQSGRNGDWFSTDTLSSVVKLSSYVNVYDVEDLPDNYTFRTKNGEPDFGNARIVSQFEDLAHVGSGVVVTAQGMILSNAHVTRAYREAEIFSVKNSEGRLMTGPGGKPIKRVLWNPLPDYMFVGVSDKARLENGNDAQELSYIAYILVDDADYENYVRDRAILQVVTKAHLDAAGNLIIEGATDESLAMSFATLGNPFKTSYSDRKVRTIGFPGTGDPNRSARTSGELMGYESEKRSVILHTSYISGGNSGGGLFYKDNLIGINTWDNQENSSRPVAKAQPITYWDDMFAKIMYLYPGVEIPEVDTSWISDDPSKEDYKNMAQVMLEVVEESNENIPVTKGSVYIHKAGTTIDDVMAYKEIAQELDRAYRYMYYLKYYTVDEVVQETDCSRELAEALKGLTEVRQMRNILRESLRGYFDVWYSDDFYYVQAYLDEENGKAIVSVPKNTDVVVTYVAANGRNYREFSLRVDSDYLQGPYTLPAKTK